MKKFRFYKFTWTPAIAAKNIGALMIRIAVIAIFLALVGFNPLGIM